MKKIFLSALTIIVLVTSCKKDNLVETDTNTNSNSNSSNPGDNTELLNELQSYAPEAQNQTKNSDEVILFTTEKGNEIIFPARAFVDGSGNPVTGNVDILVTEITKVSEMILSGMMTNSDQGPLSSQGEFNVDVSQNGQPLKLAEGSTFTIENKNAEVDKDMKGWIWKQNQTVGEAFENNTGEWIRNEFDENNPCDRMKSLWTSFKNNSFSSQPSIWKDIKPLKDLTFLELNKIDAFNGKKLIAEFNNWGGWGNWTDSSDFLIEVCNYNDKWWGVHPDYGWRFGIGPQEDFEYNQNDTSGSVKIFVNPESCSISYDNNSYSLDPNVININFSQLSWCNIDRLLSEYGQINSCKLKGNFPNHAQVKIVFKDLNGALSCSFSDDGFVAKRLPEGYDLMFLVYFKDGDAIKFGTQTITAAEEMTFKAENLKTLTDMDALVGEIEKLVD